VIPVCGNVRETIEATSHQPPHGADPAQLKLVDLRECPVGDANLPILLSLPNLSTTHLPSDRISPGVLQQIKAANEAIQAIQ
jgi:hypothetical protein